MAERVGFEIRVFVTCLFSYSYRESSFTAKVYAFILCNFISPKIIACDRILVHGLHKFYTNLVQGLTVRYIITVLLNHKNAGHVLNAAQPAVVSAREAHAAQVCGRFAMSLSPHQYLPTHSRSPRSPDRARARSVSN